jgi:excisionase family DNA binding protein
MGSKRAYSISEAMHEIAIGRDKIYDVIREGKLRARKVGRRTIITDDDLTEYLQSLPCFPHEAA